MNPAASLSRDYVRIEMALEYLAEHAQRHPSLAEVAATVHLSEHHFQRLFSRWVGVSPKKFLQHLSLATAKHTLARQGTVFDAALEAGLSGPSRLHDLFVTVEAVTPGEFKQRGAGMRLRYGFHLSPFGECLLLLSERGLCSLQFVVAGDRDAALSVATRPWDCAHLEADQTGTAELAAKIFCIDGYSGGPLKLLLQGTPFQLKVWQGLLSIPFAAVVSYQELAQHLGYHNSSPMTRAVGQAVARNAIGYLIPCHRVVRKTGGFGGYRWGVGRKLAMLGWEQVQCVSDETFTDCDA